MPGYDPKGNAAFTDEQLYQILTRYLIDEYPFATSRGTGKFEATPMRKMEELFETYGPIDAPSQEDRRLYLGVKSKMSVTSEGVLPFKIPYNSSELQRFVDRHSAKVATVHIDPDDLREATITFDGNSNKLSARLSMTVFSDLTLKAAIDVMKEAVRGNPEKRQLHEGYLWEARQRRATESGFFESPLVPDSYQGVEQLQAVADALLGVEFVPSGQAVSWTAVAIIRPSTRSQSNRQPWHRLKPPSQISRQSQRASYESVYHS